MTALTTFGETLGGSLAQRWLAAGGTAPFAFAAAGLGAWLARAGPGPGWQRLETAVAAVPTGRLLVALAAGVLALGVAGAVVAQFATPVLRLLEGYWPRPLDRPARWLADRAWARRTAAVRTVRDLTPAVDARTATPAQQRAFAAAERTRLTIPADRTLVLPTALGNRLRAAETRAWERYGLDAVTVWPSLWLALPETTRTDLAAARTRLQRTVTGLIWCALAAVWTALTWWALPAAILAAIATHRWWVHPAAVGFGQLVEATFHDHRFALYTALRLTPPRHAAEERHRGQTLTRYLARGSDDPALTFDHPTPPAADPPPGGPP